MIELDNEEMYGEVIYHTDRETGETYVINPGGYRVYINE